MNNYNSHYQYQKQIRMNPLAEVIGVSIVKKRIWKIKEIKNNKPLIREVGTLNMQIATVQLLMTDINDLGQAISGSGDIQLYEVPVIGFGDTNNYLTAKVSVGAQGILLISDRDIDNYKSIGGACQVASRNICTLKDSFFAPFLAIPSPDGDLDIVSVGTLNIKALNINIESDNISMNGIDFKEHVHIGVSTGTDNTGVVYEV